MTTGRHEKLRHHRVARKVEEKQRKVQGKKAREIARAAKRYA